MEPTERSHAASRKASINQTPTLLSSNSTQGSIQDRGKRVPTGRLTQQCHSNFIQDAQLETIQMPVNGTDKQTAVYAHNGINTTQPLIRQRPISKHHEP